MSLDHFSNSGTMVGDFEVYGDLRVGTLQGWKRAQGKERPKILVSIVSLV